MNTEIQLLRITEFSPQVDVGETPDPNSNMLVVMHKNPLDPNDETEFGFHIPVLGIATRAESLGWDNYGDVVRTAIQLAVAELRGEDQVPSASISAAGTQSPYHSPFARSTAEYFAGAAMAAESMKLPEAPVGAVRRMRTVGTVDPQLFVGLDAIASALRAEPGSGALARSSQAVGVLSEVASRSATVRSDARIVVEERTAGVILVNDDVHLALDDWIQTNVSQVNDARSRWMNHVMQASGARGILTTRIEQAAMKAFKAEEAQRESAQHRVVGRRDRVVPQAADGCTPHDRPVAREGDPIDVRDR